MLIRRSKTDQEGAGQEIAVPRRGNKLLDELAGGFAAAGNAEAVAAIREWQRRARVASGRGVQAIDPTSVLITT